MAKSDAPSVEGRHAGFYEIALSNRQLFAVFLLLGLFFASAFLLGVWFARESLPARAQAVEPAPVPAETTKGLEEYRFFSEAEGRKPMSSAAPPAAAPAPSAGAQRPAVVGATVPAGGGSSALPAPPRAASVTPPPAAAAQGAPTSAPRASTAPSSLHVQVFSSPDAGQSRRVLDQLTRAGYTAFISPIQVEARTMHRVRVGPFTDREEAQRVADQVKARFRLSSWITAF